MFVYCIQYKYLMLWLYMKLTMIESYQCWHSLKVAIVDSLYVLDDSSVLKNRLSIIHFYLNTSFIVGLIDKWKCCGD